MFLRKTRRTHSKITEICSAEAVFFESCGESLRKKARCKNSKSLKRGFLFFESQDTFSVDEALLPLRKVFCLLKVERGSQNSSVSAPEFCKIPAVSFSPARYCRNADCKRTSLWEFTAIVYFSHDFFWKHYSETRNFPALEDGTSRLSPFLRFGILSVWQIWNALQQYKHASESQKRLPKNSVGVSFGLYCSTFSRIART